MTRAALVGALVAALVPRPADASTTSAVVWTFPQLATRSASIVKGRVIGSVKVTLDGAAIPGVEIVVDAVLKGAPVAPGAHLRLLSPVEWTHHQISKSPWHEAISYGVAHYEPRLPPSALRPGATVLAFLGVEEPAPPDLPADVAFLVCGNALERPAREKELARLKAAELEVPVVLKPHEIAVTPLGAEFELVAFERTPAGEAARIEERAHGKRRRVLAHLAELVPTPDPHTEDGRLWRANDVVVVGLTFGHELALKVSRHHWTRDELH
jgi:hypothetical protein